MQNLGDDLSSIKIPEENDENEILSLRDLSIRRAELRFGRKKECNSRRGGNLYQKGRFAYASFKKAGAYATVKASMDPEEPVAKKKNHSNERAQRKRKHS